MNLLSRNAYPLDSIKEGADEPVANDTCKITNESNHTNKSKAHPPGNHRCKAEGVARETHFQGQWDH